MIIFTNNYCEFTAAPITITIIVSLQFLQLFDLCWYDFFVAMINIITKKAENAALQTPELFFGLYCLQI